MAYQARTGSAGGSSSSSSSAMQAAAAASSSADRSQSFRQGRNELAATLRGSASSFGVERRATPTRLAAQLPAIAAANKTQQAPISSAFAQSPTAPNYSSRPQHSPAKPSPPSSASASASAAAAFPSIDKEESKEAAAGSIGAATKDKDWNLWHGAAEAQWILSVLDDTQNKLTLSSLLQPDILKDPICESLDAETLLTLKEHFQVEAQYGEFLDSDLWKLNATESKNQELFQELDMCLADSTRTVTRLLKRQPALVRRMRELSGRRNPSTLDFISTFARLRQLMHAKLRMTAEEERHMREQLAELKLLEEEDTQKFIELTERLAIERNEHEQALAAKDRKIQRLAQQIAQLQSRTAQERALFEEKMREENEASEKAFRQSEKELQKQLESLQSQFEVDANENFRTELLYHRKKNLRAADVTNLIDKYDADMTLKHESVVDMQHTYAKEKKELEALNGYFQVRDEEERRIAAEHQRIRDERDAELAVERRNQQAAMLVQTLYRSYYSKVGPKEPKAKKAKKKKDPFAGLRGRPKSSKSAEESAAGPASAPLSASGLLSAMPPDYSPSSSAPEDSEPEAKEEMHAAAAAAQ